MWKIKSMCFSVWNYQEVCRECDDQCRSCEGLGTREDICECMNFNHEKQCVESCPAGYYGDKNKISQKCHKECKRCLGPSDSNCTLCENYRIYWDDGELDPNKTDMNYHLEEESSDDELIARRRRSMRMPNANESDPFFHRSLPVSFTVIMIMVASNREQQMKTYKTTFRHSTLSNFM